MSGQTQGPDLERELLIARVRALRDAGLSYGQIAVRLDISTSRAFRACQHTARVRTGCGGSHARERYLIDAGVMP